MMLRKFAFPLTVAALGLSALAARAQAPQTPPPPPGPGLDLINERCGFCHTTGQVLAARKTPADWATTVQGMIDRGAELSPDEQNKVTAYLGAHYAIGAGGAQSPGKP